MDDGLRTLGRFVWKLLFAIVLTLAAMAVVGLIVRLLFGLEVEGVAESAPLSQAVVAAHGGEPDALAPLATVVAR